MPVNLSPVGGAAVQFFTSSGVPLAGGKLYSYAAGTTTPQATYTSSGGGTASANPIVLDSAGRVSGSGEIWLTGNLEYKFILKDSTDVLIGTYDNIRGIGDTTVLLAFEALLAGSTGSSLVGYTQGGTSAVATTVQAKLRQTVSVLDFGADATGATDSSAAFTAAFVASTTVYVPAGTYKASFNMPNYGRLLGAGVLVTQIIPPAGATAVVTIDSTVSTTKSWINIEDMRIYNPNAVASCTGIYFKGTNVSTIMDYSKLNRVEVSYFAIGINVVGRMIGAYWTQVNCTLNTVGMKVNTDPASLAFNLNTFVECFFNNSAAEGLRIETISTTNKWISCDFEGNNTLNVAGVAATHMVNSQNNSFDSCYWEANGVVAVNTTVPASNSISIRLTGASLTTNPTFKNCYIVGSGCNLLIDAAVLYGGSIEQSGLNCTATGFNIAVTTDVNQQTLQDLFCVDHSNTYNGQIVVFNSSGQQFNGYIRQQSSIYYGTPTPVDMMRFNRFVVNTTGGTLTSVVITGTAGQFSCTSTTLTLGQAVTISGAFGGTGSITGYSNPTTYYIIATNGATTLTLSTTPTGAGVVTTAGTPTGLTYTQSVAIPTPSNMVAGCELYINVFGGGSVIIPATLMDTGAAVTVASGTNKTFLAMAYPWVGKFSVKT